MIADEPNDLSSDFGNIDAILSDITREIPPAYDAPGNFIRSQSTGIEAFDENTFGMHPGGADPAWGRTR